ncbi:MAG: hypothetical protein Q4E61_01240 [Alphaproteobacteria bacterium]|nr:hypothetical protein [Alphaproteobacteria bacterium]
MINIGDYVCHKTQIEEHGLGIVKSQREDGMFLVEWQNEFNEIWEESNSEDELDIE